MADQIQQVTYYIGKIPNKVGEGARLLKAVSEAGVSLAGFLGYPKSARKTEIVLIVDDKAPKLGPIAKPQSSRIVEAGGAAIGGRDNSARPTQGAAEIDHVSNARRTS